MACVQGIEILCRYLCICIREMPRELSFNGLCSTIQKIQTTGF